MSEVKVLAVTPSAGEGSWLKLRVVGKNKEGQEIEKDNYVKDTSLFPLITQPGFYEFTKKKNGQYFEIVGAKFIRPLETTANGMPQTSPNPTNSSGKTIDANVIKQNDSICAQVAVKAAADIVCEALRQKVFSLPGVDDKIASFKTDFTEVIDNAAILARAFMVEIGKFVNEKKESPTLAIPFKSTPNDKIYLDDAGRTHERVVEGA